MKVSTPATLACCAGLLVATPPSPAQAESSITLYGILDSGLAHEQFRYRDDKTAIRATRNGVGDGYLKSNRWGLKGSEDLGSGWHAIFQLEQGFSLITGEPSKTGLMFSRKAVMGLSSEHWGTVTVGRQKPLGGDFLKLDTTKSMGKASKAFGARGSRTNKLAKYISPSMGGVRVGVAYATNGSVQRDTTTGVESRVDRDYLFSAGATVSRGRLRLAGVYDVEHGNKKDGHRRGYRIHNWAVAASYDFNHVKLNLAYGEDRHGKLKSPGNVGSKTFGGLVTVPGLGDYNTRGFKSRNYLVSVAAPIGPTQLGLSWTRSSSNLGRVYEQAHPGHQLSTQTQNIYAASLTYPWSKRTKLYIYGSYGTGLAYLRGLKGREAGIGINHRF